MAAVTIQNKKIYETLKKNNGDLVLSYRELNISGSYIRKIIKTDPLFLEFKLSKRDRMFSCFICKKRFAFVKGNYKEKQCQTFGKRYACTTCP